MKKLFTIFALSFFCNQAFAFPLPQNGGGRAATFLPEQWGIIPPNLGFLGVDFSGILALNNCSGSLVRLEKSIGTDKAMALTNGHCFEGGFVDPGKVRVRVPSTRSFSILSQDGKRSLGSLKANSAVFATMTKTDIAIYQLTVSYDDIEKTYGIRPLTLSSKHPEAKQNIAIASGYWRRIYNCAIERFVHKLKEDKWTFTDSIRYSKPGCETIGGTSGSPIIDAETREIVGINNTGNNDGERCTMNNPCEVDRDGVVTYEKGADYGQQTYLVYTCLQPDNSIDLKKPGCLLIP